MKQFARLTIVTVAVLCSHLTLWAQHISEQQARARVVEFFHAQSGSHVRRAPAVNRELKAVSIDASSIYAFNCEGGGFVIASGDSRTLPVLGYSTTGSLDWERMPENMRAWLKSYDDAVATLGDRTDFVDGNALNDAGMSLTNTRSDKAPVEPFIKSHWDQLAPYWDLAPLYDGADPNKQGEQCLAGCMATAMAQVMNYYQWPQTVPDGIPAYEYETEYKSTKKVWQIDALPPVTFDWDNMLDDYVVMDPETGKSEEVGTEGQKRAVATLMRYCGQAVKMEYDPDESGSRESDEQLAYVNYFGYPAATLLYRSAFDIDEWEDLIYGELAAKRPVRYNGYSDDGGHAFICDGYDENGMFHINWGWGGCNDGYFSLSILNPYNNTSAGSGSSGIGFSINQSAIIYIDPTLEKQFRPSGSRPQIYQNHSIRVQGKNTVRFDFFYRYEDAGEAVFDHALGTMDEEGHLTPRFMGDPNDSIVYPSNYMLVDIESSAFQPGDSLTLYPMLCSRKPGAEWLVVSPVESHVVAGRTDEGRFFIHVYGDIFQLECVGGSITKGTGKLNQRSDVTISVRNLGEKDYVDELYLTPSYYGYIEEADITDKTPFLSGEKMECGAYIRAGQEEEVTFSFVPKKGGLVVFKAYDAVDKYIGYFTLELTEDTRISDAGYVPTATDESYYDLMGRPFNGIPTQKGVYIKGDKKVVIR